MCNFGVRSRFLDVIYGVRPPNGSPAFIVRYGVSEDLARGFYFFFMLHSTEFEINHFNIE